MKNTDDDRRSGARRGSARKTVRAEGGDGPQARRSARIAPLPDVLKLINCKIRKARQKAVKFPDTGDALGFRDGWNCRVAALIELRDELVALQTAAARGRNAKLSDCD